MQRLRARHWLAVITALGLIVVAYRAEVTVDEAPVSLESIGVEEIPDPAAPQTDEEHAPPLTSEVAGQRAGNEPAATAPSGPVAPLTGLPTTQEISERSALFVKIDNHRNARPQTGLEMADIVFDMRAESVTRFAAVFQSQIPDPVGPVRSSRTSDFDLLRGFDTPVYGSSGGNDHVLEGLRSLPIVQLTAQTRHEYFRHSSRNAPHNLYVNGSDLMALAGDDLPTPGPWFQYRAPGDELPVEAVPAVGPITISYTEAPVVTHTWDATARGWLRTQDGSPHITADEVQLAPENVVIFVTDYSISAADPLSPEVRSTGEGRLVVLTAGHLIEGTWSRDSPTAKPVLSDRNGELIRLTPGRTWVLLPEPGQVRFAAGQTPP